MSTATRATGSTAASGPGSRRVRAGRRPGWLPFSAAGARCLVAPATLLSYQTPRTPKPTAEPPPRQSATHRPGPAVQFVINRLLSPEHKATKLRLLALCQGVLGACR